MTDFCENVKKVGLAFSVCFGFFLWLWVVLVVFFVGWLVWFCIFVLNGFINALVVFSVFGFFLF